jgi:hypothetical protein
MRLNEIQSNKVKSDKMPLNELSVFSSWISDLAFTKKKVTIMRLNTGRKYQILGLPPGMFREWMRSASKGKYWHGYIKGHYRTTRM